MVVTVSHLGYIKRVPLSTYRAQRRGGKGRSGMQTRDEDFVTRLFVANTHQPVLYFSSHGRVYKQKVWKLPQAAPQARGKALINILPLSEGETINTIMPLPEDEKTWETLDVMFATTRGTVRRNKLSDFADVRPSGIIAMKIDEGEGIVGVQICTEKDDVLLTAAGGQCIRFAVPEVRVFAGRTSMGVRGINLEEGDKVISLSILRHVEATADERAAYLKRASAVRRGEEGEEGPPDAEETGSDLELGEQRYVEMSEAEQFVLTVSEKGMGKRSSSFQYRTTGRGGKGIVAMAITPKTGKLVASFPVEGADQIMLVTNGGQLIRTRVEGIRIAGRSTQGVIVFDTADDERVVSVEHIPEEGEENGNARSRKREAVFGYRSRADDHSHRTLPRLRRCHRDPDRDAGPERRADRRHQPEAWRAHRADRDGRRQSRRDGPACRGGRRPLLDRRAVRQELRPDPLRRRGVSAVPRHPDLVEVARSGRRRAGRSHSPRTAPSGAGLRSRSPTRRR